MFSPFKMVRVQVTVVQLFAGGACSFFSFVSVCHLKCWISNFLLKLIRRLLTLIPINEVARHEIRLKIPFSSICITSRRCPNPQTLLKTPQHHHLPPPQKKKANPHLCDFSSLNSFLFAILKTNRANSVTDSFPSREVFLRYQLLSPPPDPPDLKKRSGDGLGTSTMGESGGPFDSVS